MNVNVNEIDERMASLVTRERGIAREILELIRHAESIRLPEQLGYRDTYQWLIQRHKYSGSAANRRIQASRLLKDLPEVAEKIEAGSVNLSTLCRMQTVMRAQQKVTGEKLAAEAKREAISKIENKTCNEAEQVLFTMFPEAEVVGEKTVQKSDGGQRCTTELSAEAVKLLERVRELLSHAMPGASIGQLIERLAKEFVELNDPLIRAEKKKRSATATVTQGNNNEGYSTQSDNTERDNLNGYTSQDSKNKSSAIPPKLRREVIRRAGAQCQYTHNGKRCISRYQLETDHIISRAMGGTNKFENLQCLCRRHNQMKAELEFGRDFMERKRSNSMA